MLFNCLYPFLLFLLILPSTSSQSTESRSISFSGNYTQTTNNFVCSWKYPNQLGSVEIKLKDQEGNIQTLPQYINNIEVKLFNKFILQDYYLINIDLKQFQYNDQQWKSKTDNQTFSFQHIINNKIHSQNISTGQISIYLYGDVVRKFIMRIQVVKDYSCNIVYRTDLLYYSHSPSTFALFVVIQYFIALFQLISLLTLDKGYQQQVVSLKRISLISFSSILILTSTRVVKQIKYVFENDKYYFVPLLIITIFILLLMFDFCRQIAFIGEINSQDKIEKFCIALVGFCFFYNYLKFNNITQLWAQLIIPIICYIYQSRLNYQLKGKYSKVYYSYYIGLLLPQFIQPFYYYAKSDNIFYVQTSAWRATLWCILFIFGTITMLLQFKYFFKPETQQMIRRATRTSVKVSPFRMSSDKIEVSQTFPLADYLADGMFIPECSICLAEITEEMEKEMNEVKSQLRNELLEVNGEDYPVKTNCGHFFHKRCIVEWLRRNKNCPICRNKGVQFYILIC